MEKPKPNKAKPQPGKVAPSASAPAPVPTQVPPLFRRIDWLAFIVAFAAIWIAYLYTLAPDLTLEDSGELCTAAMFLDGHRLLVGRNDGTMSGSADGGRTFAERPGLATVIGLQPTKSSQDEAFWIQGFAQAGGTIYATTKFAGAYLSTNGGQTWARETTCDSAYSLGIGEVAAFDGTRAIAGGPTCLSTRTGSPVGLPSGAPAGQGVREVSGVTGVDTVSSARGLTVSITGGRVLRVSSLRRAASPAG